MILTDREISKLVEDGKLIAEGYDPDNLGGVSYDLTVDTIVREEDSEESIYECELHPGDVIFFKTKELLLIPEDVLGRIAQKNSRMRMGLYVDGPHYQPGHKTYAYLRVWNNSTDVITVKTGDKLAQIFFERLESVPFKKYGDRKTDAFADETRFVGLGKYKSEYQKYIKKAKEIKEDLDSKEAQIYANVLTLMGIVAAVFAIITINFEAFQAAQIDLKFLLLMNLTLSITLCVFFGLLHLVVSHQKKAGFGKLYAGILAALLAAALFIFIFL